MPVPGGKAAATKLGQYHGRALAGIAMLDSSGVTRWETRWRPELAGSHSNDGGLVLGGRSYCQTYHRKNHDSKHPE